MEREGKGHTDPHSTLSFGRERRRRRPCRGIKMGRGRERKKERKTKSNFLEGRKEKRVSVEEEEKRFQKSRPDKEVPMERRKHTRSSTVRYSALLFGYIIRKILRLTNNDVRYNTVHTVQQCQKKIVLLLLLTAFSYVPNFSHSSPLFFSLFLMDEKVGRQLTDWLADFLFPFFWLMREGFFFYSYFHFLRNSAST